jgi:hypothetical protein
MRSHVPVGQAGGEKFRKVLDVIDVTQCLWNFPNNLHMKGDVRCARFVIAMLMPGCVACDRDHF